MINNSKLQKEADILKNVLNKYESEEPEAKTCLISLSQVFKLIDNNQFDKSMASQWKSMGSDTQSMGSQSMGSDTIDTNVKLTNWKDCSMLDKELYSELVKQNKVLIDKIVLAITDSIKTNKLDSDAPNWKTHLSWENKVLPNMRKTQEHLENANDELSIGNEDEAGRMCGVVGGIGKDIDDFDTSWMDGVSKTNIESQLDIVVELADTISRSR